MSEPDDFYEREADRVAELIMGSSDAEAPDGSSRDQDGHDSVQPFAASVPSIQRVCSDCDEELRLQSRDDKAPKLQAHEHSGNTPHMSPDLGSQIGRVGDGTQPLPPPVRAFFEPRFGYDFSKVRLHADERAAGIARAVRSDKPRLRWNVHGT
ncbi:MAG TPA: DUF4157 domain-containing protein [Blastocatellia bacterium]|nr:DUF4157 domain-containing protein [Blastocatellia bacterium]